MRSIVHKLLIEHPNSVDEGYFEHMRFALGFAGVLFLAAGAALVHAFVPGLCERTASEKIKMLYRRIENR